VSDMYLRRCSIVLGSGGNALELSQLRCRFNITMAVNGKRNELYLRVTNLNPSTAAPFLQSPHQPITVSAGYQSGQYGQIFSGDTTWVVSGRENPTDTMLTVVAHDGGAGHVKAAVNKQFPAGSTPQDRFNAALQAMSPFNISKGYVGPDLSSPKYPRSDTYLGMAWQLLERVAQSKQAVWNIQQGKIQMLKQSGDNVPGSPVVLNTNTGLIGMPSQEIDQVLARCLINPSIVVGSQVQIAQGLVQPLVIVDNGAQVTGTSIIPPGVQAIAADGIYTVFAIDVEGDTRGMPWYYDLHLMNPNNASGTVQGQTFGGSQGASVQFSDQFPPAQN
jgi:hypothetical protein